MKRFFALHLGGGLAISLLLLLGCTTEDIGENLEKRFPDGLPIRLSTSDYNNQNTYYMLNDDESSEVFFNTSERQFYTDQPLQLTVDDALFFQLRFYSPRALPNVTIWAKIEGYDEAFKLFVFEKVMPFQQFRMQLPFATEDIKATTRSGKLIRIMANPHLDNESISFEIECDAPYWKTLQAIKTRWNVRFSAYNPNQVGDREGFVKLLFDADDKLAGAHLVGANVTEMLAEPTLARTLGATAEEIVRTIHAHPTLNEGVAEAAEAALGRAIHL